MAASVTLAEMRTRARQMADMEVGAASSRVTDTELDHYLNSELQALYDKLIRARGDDYYQAYGGLTTIATQAGYNWSDFTVGTSTATDFYRLTSLWLGNGTDAAQVPAYEEKEIAKLVRDFPSGSTSDIHSIMYSLRPYGVHLYPAPAGAYTLGMNYIPAMPTLSAPSDTFDGVNGWEDYAILGAAIKCKQKDGEDPSVLLALKADAAARIDSLASNRDAHRPARIVDVCRGRRRWTRLGLRDDWDW